MLFQLLTKHNKENKLYVRWQYGLFMGVATRTNALLTILKKVKRVHLEFEGVQTVELGEEHCWTALIEGK